MSSDPNKIDLLCNEVHSIMMGATKDLPVPNPKNARDIRKKISVFTYGVISQLADQAEIDKDQVYEKYLVMGGLSTEQASIIVKRTRDEFLKREFGENCMESGKTAVRQWRSGDKNIQSIVEALL
ncbi:MAG: hypothetical protein ACR2PU_02140 [Gammaproteobacteria bacterium]